MLRLLTVGIGIIFALAILRVRGPVFQAEVINATPAATTLAQDDPRVSALFETARAHGLASALDSLDALARATNTTESSLHQIAHSLGKLAMQHSGYDLAMVRDCRISYEYGCIHGAVESYFGRPGAMNDRSLAELCAVGDGMPASVALECAHGAGHGLLSVTGHDLRATLEYCDRLSGSRASWCYSGAFMENVNAGLRESAGGEHAHQGPAGQHDHLRANDRQYPCNVVADRYRHACYQYLSFPVMRANGFDYVAALRECDRAPSSWAGSCYEGFGLQAAGLFAKRPRQLLDLCHAGRNDLVARCVAGAADYLVVADRRPTLAFDFCDEADGPARSACFEKAGWRIGLMNDYPAPRAASCARAGSARDVLACRTGAGLVEPTRPANVAVPEPVVDSILQWARAAGPRRALARLDTLAAQRPEVARVAHNIAHSIGKVAMAASGDDPATVAGCTPAWQSGCYHGAVQRYLEFRGSASDDAVRSVCAPPDTANGGGLALRECAHGLGHALNHVLGHDLVTVLDRCDSLPRDLPEWCYSGAFMENLANAGAERARAQGDANAGAGHDTAAHHHGGATAAPHEHIRADDPFYPCSALGERYQRECWKYQSVVLMMRARNDFAAAARGCAGAPPSRVEWCFEGLGIQAAGLSVHDVDAMLALCALAPPSGGAHCMRGAADYLFAEAHSTEYPFALCARGAPASRDGCFERVGLRIAQAHARPEDRERECTAAIAGGRAACRKGASLVH